MTRRDLALVVTFCAAVGGAGVVLLSLRDSGGGDPFVARSKTPAGAPRIATPAGADGAASQAAALASSEPTTTDLTAVRALDGAEEVDFPGLIELSQRPGDEVVVDGTLVLKNADPAAPPLRLEIPFRQNRFRGRGPGNAVVVVEKLVVAGREAVAKEESYPLAGRWVHVHATLATPFLLHVVDAASSRELTGVTLRESRHDEDATKPSRSGASSGWFSLIRAKRPLAPAEGFDSPIELASFGWNGGHNGIPRSDEEADAVFAHAPGYGDDFCTVGENATEGTIRLRPAATLRVRVTPWPPSRADDKTDVAKLYVTIARRVEPSRAAREKAANDLDELPTGLAPRIAALAREAIERRDRRLLAAVSPQSHVALADSDGVAKFDDLCEGEWLAWAGPHDVTARTNVIVDDRRLAVRGDLGAFASIDPLEVTLRVGSHEELTLRCDAAAPPAFASLIVRAVDATTGAAVALGVDEFEAEPLDEPGPTVRENAAGTWINRGVGRLEITEGGDGKEAARVVKPGAAIVHVLPRSHPEFDPLDLVVELKEGANEVEVRLPRTQAVVVSIDADKAFARGGVNWFDATSIRLTRNGVEYEAKTWWIHGRNEPSRRMQRFGPLDPGRYTLIVPHDAGFDREGEIAVDVRLHEITTIELALRPTGAPLGAGR